MYRNVKILLLGVCFLACGPARAQVTGAAVTGQKVVCANGDAAGYACGNVDLMAFLPLSSLGGAGSANDIWGWTDPQTGREYALVGLSDGTAFVDVSDPVTPVYLGKLPTHTGPSAWRDIKTYADHAYVVADAAGSHGMQVFDLTQLRGRTGPPVLFEETVHYDSVASAHNIAIDEDTGFAYIVGANGGGVTCGGGLHMVDIRDPERPAFAGCFQDLTTGRRGTGYTHDVQCVVYHGPDADYTGREICVGSNETAISIADVTVKERSDDDPRCTSCAAISTATYPDVGYIHQGWLTEDHRYFFQDDELDATANTRTLIWDLTDLDDPQLLAQYFGPSTSRDHNLYIVGHYVFEANYTSGLRILDIRDVAHPVEVGFFDTYPANDGLSFAGAWSNYPFFKSGVIVVSSIGEGLFVVQPNGTIQVATETEAVPEAFVLSPAYPNPFNPQTTFTLTLPALQRVTVAVYDVLGRRVALLHEGLLAAGTHRLSFEASGLPGGTYLIRAVADRTVRTRTATLLK